MNKIWDVLYAEPSQKETDKLRIEETLLVAAHNVCGGKGKRWSEEERQKYRVDAVMIKSALARAGYAIINTNRLPPNNPYADKLVSFVVHLHRKYAKRAKRSAKNLKISNGKFLKRIIEEALEEKEQVR
jgi:hypothetical protein